MTELSPTATLAYHVSEVELYKSPWGKNNHRPTHLRMLHAAFAISLRSTEVGQVCADFQCAMAIGSVMKPVASLFSPLLVIPLSWVLLPPTCVLCPPNPTRDSLSN